MTRSIRLALRFCSLACVAAPQAVDARASCSSAVSETPSTSRQWPPPLDRLISVHERGVALRDALDRVDNVTVLPGRTITGGLRAKF